MNPPLSRAGSEGSTTRAAGLGSRRFSGGDGMAAETERTVGGLTFKLVNTCDECPEQYDVILCDHFKVAYLRLRHGCFTAEIWLSGR